MATGLFLCAVLSAAAVFASASTAVPSMLAVLLLGIATRGAFPTIVAKVQPGIDFCAGGVLRLGVALLGLRMAAGDLLALGPAAIAVVLVSVVATLAGGYGIARAMRQRMDMAAVSATSVSICGASAALAASSVAPRRPGLQQETALVVLTVSLLSTVVMVAYPWIAYSAALDPRATAMLFGAAIHDVAQVAGAGLAVSPDIAVQSVAVKMIRVCCLFPVVLLVGYMLVRRNRQAPSRKVGWRPLMPPFLLAFLFLALVTSFGVVPRSVTATGAEAANWLLIAAVAAIGLNTSLEGLRNTSPRLACTLVLQTMWQFAVVFLLINFLPAQQ